LGLSVDKQADDHGKIMMPGDEVGAGNRASYLAKNPSTLPATSTPELRSATNEAKWIKDEWIDSYGCAINGSVQRVQ
jgi:hypothetical protein